MSAELQAHGSIARNVAATTKTQKLAMPKKLQKKIDEKAKERKEEKKKNKQKDDNQPQPEGKRPRAADVREALKKGKIKPAEAADLNPLGGLKPSVKDVRDAVKGGHISPEEGYNLNRDSVKSPRAPKAPKAPKQESEDKASSGPTFVYSERTNSPSGLNPRPIEAPRQWKTNGL